MFFFSKIFKQQKLTDKDFLNALKCQFKLIYSHRKKSKINRNKKNFSHSQYQKNKIKELISKNIPLIKNAFFNIDKTKELLDNKISILNAVLENKKYKTNIDYIIFENNNIYIYNINYSFYGKNTNVEKLAFQKMILNHFDLKVDKFFLLYINKYYVFKNKLNENLLIKKLEVTEDVNSIYWEVKEKAENFYKILNQKIIFSTKNFQICNSKQKCEYINICNPKIKNTDIFTLNNSSHQIDELLENNITKISKIKNIEIFNEKAKIQIKTVQNSNIYINKENIRSFLNLIKYPIYFLDFECFSTLIPIYEKSSPSQNIPFQYSLHYQKNENAELEHFSYLNKSKKIDPREEILKNLSQLIKTSCTIICYNTEFEKRCIRDSVDIFKKYKMWFKKIETEFLDLAEPFSNFDYYHNKQRGSTSLKTILPLITNLSYSDLEINQGYNANSLYLKTITENIGEVEKNKIYKNLEKYCYLDTYALFEILKELREMTSS